MRINEHTALLTPTVVLTPYSAHHVPRYHAWMQSPALRAATASDPLTLAEEHAMQRAWRHDHDKLTFIVCVPGLSAPASTSASAAPERSRDALADLSQMAGDVNLFVSADDDGQVQGEIEIMIAESAAQGRGVGRAALTAFLAWVVQREGEIVAEFHGKATAAAAAAAAGGIAWFTVKIDQGNARSIALFESVGFDKVGSEPNYFGEFELRCTRERFIGSVGELWREQAGEVREARYVIPKELLEQESEAETEARNSIS